ncbi:MBL fold metallo-hydrolase [Proteiniphilum sp. UBA1028]|mgnify:FL=1|jgi:glyoxylase-like metal-dependent hydrolase (beta-lactamase superfamily II)|uniref:MBL fold metallo-hydrolase n=1 Tax=Proteiniphilum sp. UBA1028 TaxID=1947251 RepID=UPI0025F246F8|nr:MBL fold metallo-hydrolase [Proteiniphilum sp. UBA1028]
MKIKIFEFNPLGVNTYVLSDASKECVVIDAACFYADERELLLNYILDHDFVVKHVINTHLHFDHLFGVNMLASQFGITLSCHQADEFLLENIPAQLKLFGLPNVNTDFKPDIGRYLHEGDRIHFGTQILEVIHLPGHSPGSVVFYHKAEGVLFSGDALFHSGIGRTDLAGGDYDLLVKGIQTKLFSLPEETRVYAGHGPATTIGYEEEHNPFVGEG